MSKDWPQQKMSDREMDESMDLVEGKLAQAAANKAAEEGELPELQSMKKVIRQALGNTHIEDGSISAFDQVVSELASAVVAADRTSRQVANKAEVEPVAWMNPSEPIISNAFQGWKDKYHTEPVYATPPATTGASTAPRPTDDELWDATLRDRDAYHDWADKLADAIANYFGVDIGEHSNQNLPWDEALQAIENAEPVGASTVLTDERIDAIMAKYSAFIAPGVYSLYSFECVEDVRSFAREVAAQAGQVAVPGWQLVPIVPTPEMIAAIHFKGDLDIAIGHAQFYKDAEEDYAAMLAAAPSPAKESK